MMVIAAVACRPTSVARHGAMLDVLMGVAAVAVASIVLVSLARAIARPVVVGRIVVRVFGDGESVVDVPMQVIELAVILLMLRLAGEAGRMLGGVRIFDLLMLTVVFQMIVQMIELILRARRFRRRLRISLCHRQPWQAAR